MGRWKVLDVGCGSNPKGDVNVDLFLEPLHRGGETMQLKFKQIKNFIIADAHYLPFKDDVFDIVYASHLLEHVTHPFNVLKEFNRVSKLIVYINIPYGDKSPDDFHGHIYSWTMHSFRNLLSKLFPYVEIYATENFAQVMRKNQKFGF